MSRMEHSFLFLPRGLALPHDTTWTPFGEAHSVCIFSILRCSCHCCHSGWHRSNDNRKRDCTLTDFSFLCLVSFSMTVQTLLSLCEDVMLHSIKLWQLHANLTSEEKEALWNTVKLPFPYSSQETYKLEATEPWRPVGSLRGKQVSIAHRLNPSDKPWGEEKCFSVVLLRCVFNFFFTWGRYFCFVFQ